MVIVKVLQHQLHQYIIVTIIFEAF